MPAKHRVFILSGGVNAAGIDIARTSVLYTDLKEEYPDDTIILVRVATQGHSMSDWIRDDEEHGVFYDSIVAKFKAVTRTLPQVDSVVLLWMHGESNANLVEEGGAAANVENYEDRLRQLFTDLREELVNENAKVPVVIGKISDYGGVDENWDAIRDIQVAVAGDITDAALVDTDDLNNPGNTFTHNKAGRVEFAHRLATEAITLLAAIE